MRKYIINKVAGDIDWSAIETAPIDCLLWSDPVPITADYALCYDETGLHVRLRTQEPHIRAEYTGKLDAPCEDSCLEFFLSPIEEDTRYFNIELNPNCCQYLGFGSNRYNLMRLIPEEDPIQPKAQRIDGGWMVTYRIPWSFIRQFFPDFQPIAGTVMRANFYKCGDLTVQPHYFSWNPIDLVDPDFHCPAYFGILQLG